MIDGIREAFSRDVYADVIDQVGGWQERSLRALGDGEISLSVLPHFQDFESLWDVGNWLDHLATENKEPALNTEKIDILSLAVAQFWPARPSFTFDGDVDDPQNFKNLFRELDADFLVCYMSDASKDLARQITADWESSVRCMLLGFLREQDGSLLNGLVGSTAEGLRKFLDESVIEEKCFRRAVDRLVDYESKIVRRSIESYSRGVSAGDFSMSPTVVMTQKSLLFRFLKLVRRIANQIASENPQSSCAEASLPPCNAEDEDQWANLDSSSDEEEFEERSLEDNPWERFN